MNKHRYRATDINDIKWTKLAADTAAQPLVLGVDVAKEDFVGVLMKPDRSVVKKIKWRQSMELIHRKTIFSW